MGFVIELVPEDERDRLVRDGIARYPAQRVVDHERDAALFYDGDGDDPREGFVGLRYFVLCWRGKRIEFEATDGCNRKLDGSIALIWTIHRVAYPRSLGETEAAVHRMVTDSLGGFGWYFRNDRIARLIVYFDAGCFIETEV